MGRSGAWADGQVGDVEKVKDRMWGDSSRLCILESEGRHRTNERSGVLKSQRSQEAGHSKQIPSEDSYDNRNVRT